MAFLLCCLTCLLDCNLLTDVPDSPKHLQASEVTKTSVTLTWEEPQKDGGSPITGYVLERCQLPRTSWTKANKKPVPDTMFTLENLVEGAEYKFRVSAENAVGVGKPSEPTSPITAKDPYGKTTVSLSLSDSGELMIVDDL